MCVLLIEYIMRKVSINNISRVLCALLLCVGFAFTGCTDGPLGDEQNTEQGGNENNGNEHGGDNAGGSQDKPTDENEVKSGPVTITIDNITATTVTFKGNVDVAEADRDFSIVTVRYSEPDGFSAMNEKLPKVSATSFDENGDFTIVLDKLNYNTTYKYCVIAKVRTEETYSEKVMSFTTENISINLADASSITATTAQIFGTIEGLSESDKSQIQVGMLYSSEEGKVENGQGTKLTASEISADNTVSFVLSDLTMGTTYYYRSYVQQGAAYVYGEVKTFVVGNVSVNLSDASSITAITALISGTVEGLSESDKSLIEVGVLYSSEEGKVENGQGTKLTASEISADNTVSFVLSELTPETTYYYCSYVKQGGSYSYGTYAEFTTLKHPYELPSDLNVSSASDLSSAASANCYIVSNSGLYKFKTVKGNSLESVGSVASASILWETFGTSSAPVPYDLIKAVDYENGYIAFQTADTFKEGNAVIAAKDASGNILWSWHIWLTDQPEGQIYYNNAGTMMDRNLGATSATLGDVGALGLLYQWGRKDPFLGSSSISSNTLAKSTITWPSYVTSNSSTGTIAYAAANPTTFITYDSDNTDWYYTGSGSTDNIRWTTSESTKSIYDPCPAGWRVPDGGDNGVWSKALGSSDNFSGYPYDRTNKGMNFSGKFGSDQTVWYPYSGCRSGRRGGLDDVGDDGHYWSASPYGSAAYFLQFGGSGFVYLLFGRSPGSGLSVRCLQVID